MLSFNQHNYQQWFHGAIQRVSARAEVAAPYLTALKNEVTDELHAISRWVSLSKCTSVLIDVGGDAATMVASIFTPTLDEEQALRPALGPFPWCGLCSVVLAEYRDDLYVTQALKARGAKVLVLNSTASVLSGVRRVGNKSLRRALPLAAIVDVIAELLGPSQQLLLRLGEGLEAAHASVLISHLIMEQALCRTHRLLLASRWRGETMGTSATSAANVTMDFARRMRSMLSAAVTPHETCATVCTRAECSRGIVSRAASGGMAVNRGGMAFNRRQPWPTRCLANGPSTLGVRRAMANDSGAAMVTQKSIIPPMTSQALAAHTDAKKPALASASRQLSVHALQLAAHAAAELHAVGQLIWAHNCTHAYLDIGSNIGVQIRKLYEPHKYTGAAVLPIFDTYFGRDITSRCAAVCAVGVEPNPRHGMRLSILTSRLHRAGRTAIAILPAAAATAVGVLPLSRSRGSTMDRWNDIGASSVRRCAQLGPCVE